MRPLRLPLVQKALSVLLAAWLRLCFATARWRYDNRAAAEAIWDAGGGVIVCFWHSRISLSPASWDLERGQEPRALISLSADGEFIAKAVARLGFPAIRGSSAKKGAPEKEKGGSAAFREVLRWVRAGNCIAVTPDGPRGPAEQMAEGAPLLARMTRAPVLMLGLAARPCLRLNSWDKAVVPLPFSRAAIAWDVVRFGPDDTVEGVREAWAARLTALTERAEAMVR